MNDPHFKPRQNIFKVSENLATQYISSVATLYPGLIARWTPNTSYKKTNPFMEKENKELKSLISNSETEESVKGSQNLEDDLERSLRRSRKMIKAYSLMNQFELLVTFTFNNQKNDRLDHIKVKARMSNWLKNQQKRAGKFEYLIVAEFHKKHEALHFHSLIKGYVGDIRESRSSVTGRLLRQKGKQVFELPSFKSGFTNVKKIDNNPTSHSKVATYLGKYITKDMPYFANKQRYWISKCLQTPETIDNPPDSLFIGELLWEHKNDFGILEYFERPHLNEALKYA